jgi:hypothetical protein
MEIYEELKKQIRKSNAALLKIELLEKEINIFKEQISNNQEQISKIKAENALHTGWQAKEREILDEIYQQALREVDLEITKNGQK